MSFHLPATLCRILLLLILGALPMASRAIEEPDFEVVRTLGDVQLRRYAPYVVAEVVVDATPDDAGRQAFPILAGYIFGKNKGETKLAMTAPVTQFAAPRRMEMPASVQQSAVASGISVQFVLPKGTTLATAPEPVDPRVRLHEMPSITWAALRYSGFWSQANYLEHLDQLKAALAAAGIASQGEPVLARYNAPFTPWFLRRNEVWLAVP